jgi:hypothetical protein
MVWVRAMNIDDAYVTRKSAIHVPFTLTTLAKTDKEKALLESRANHNFQTKESETTRAWSQIIGQATRHQKR